MVLIVIVIFIIILVLVIMIIYIAVNALLSKFWLSRPIVKFSRTRVSESTTRRSGARNDWIMYHLINVIYVEID